MYQNEPKYEPMVENLAHTLPKQVDAEPLPHIGKSVLGGIMANEKGMPHSRGQSCRSRGASINDEGTTHSQGNSPRSQGASQGVSRAQGSASRLLGASALEIAIGEALRALDALYPGGGRAILAPAKIKVGSREPKRPGTTLKVYPGRQEPMKSQLPALFSKMVSKRPKRPGSILRATSW